MYKKIKELHNKLAELEACLVLEKDKAKYLVEAADTIYNEFEKLYNEDFLSIEDDVFTLKQLHPSLAKTSLKSDNKVPGKKSPTKKTTKKKPVTKINKRRMR